MKSLTCLVGSTGVSVHGRPKIKIILKAVEAPAHRLMQRSEAGVGLVDPEESGANAALMHHAIEIVLQSKKIKRVAAEIVEIIVIHARAFKLETYCANDLAGLAVDDDPLIYDVPVQAIFGGQVIGVFVKSLKEILIDLVDVSRGCVFERRIWLLWGQSIS